MRDGASGFGAGHSSGGPGRIEQLLLTDPGSGAPLCATALPASSEDGAALHQQEKLVAENFVRLKQEQQLDIGALERELRALQDEEVALSANTNENLARADSKELSLELKEVQRLTEKRHRIELMRNRMRALAGDLDLSVEELSEGHVLLGFFHQQQGPSAATGIAVPYATQGNLTPALVLRVPWRGAGGSALPAAGGALGPAAALAGQTSVSSASTAARLT